MFENRIVAYGEEPIDEILFNPNNWRVHPEKQQRGLKAVLGDVGWVQGVIINRTTGHLVDGHARVKIAAKAGMKTIPAIYVELTQKEEDLILATFDPIGKMAVADKQQLDELMSFLETSDEDLNQLLKDVAAGERLGVLAAALDAPDAKADEGKRLRELYGTEPGQLWQLGRHRLACIDSTDTLQIKRLMDGKKADMMFTDPPYLMGYHGQPITAPDAARGKVDVLRERLVNDKLDDGEAGIFLAKIAIVTREFVKGSFYICFYRLGIEKLIAALQDNGLTYASLIIWYKSQLNLSGSDYQTTYEPIVYGWNQEHNFYGGRGQTDVITATRLKDGTPQITTQAKAVYFKAGGGFYKLEKLQKQPQNYIDAPDDKIVFNIHQGENDIWEIAKTKSNDLHPTMKPIELVTKALSNSSRPGDIILDPFVGSGTTLVAAEITDRTFYGAEISPEYTAVAIQRWVDETGETPELKGAL